MIRKTTININYSNMGKLQTLNSILEESKKVINLYIDYLWELQDFKSKYIKFKVKSWLSARMLQNLGKQALQIVKSQRKKKNKTKPSFDKNTIEFDPRFIDISFDTNSFDIWIHIQSIGKKISLNLPSKKHKHFHTFIGWNLKKSIRLRKNEKGYFIDLYFQKKEPDKRIRGKVLGGDIGYKKLLMDSEGIISDVGLEQVYEKISRKKQGSKAFKRALTERDSKINESINKKDLSDVKEMVMEDLCNVKHKSKGKIRKKFSNKLQRWSYPKVLGKLECRCEEEGILFTKVPPEYTSQKCSKCGVIEKTNRKGEKYQCACGNIMDADHNAAINISHMGVYSPHALYQENLCQM